MANTNDEDELFDLLDQMLKSEEESNDSNVENGSQEDDILSLLDDGILNNTTLDSTDDDTEVRYSERDNSVSSNDDDIFSMDSLFGSEDSTSTNLSNTENTKNPENISDIFSDVLGAVSSLEDPLEDISDLIPDINDSKSAKKNKILNELDQNHISDNKKKNFFAKLFGNIKDKTDEEYEKQIQAEQEQKLKKEENKKIKAAQKKEDKAKKQEAANERKKAKAATKNEAIKEKNERKAQKLEEKKKRLEEESKQYEGRINKVGASIVMAFAMVGLIVVIAGTNSFSYKNSIINATKYLDKQKYNKAYNEVAGLEIKDKDEELYHKIYTIMIVNKELNSYTNYSAMNKYPEALDSLLKGISKYEKYIEKGKTLGVESDLNNVKKQIVVALKDDFQLSEKDAYELLKIEDPLEYGDSVYKAASIKLENKQFTKNK